MSQYDFVTDGSVPLVIDCPECGESLTDFQSRSGPRRFLDVDWKLLDTAVAQCSACRNFIQLRIERPPITVRMLYGDKCVKEAQVTVGCSARVEPTVVLKPAE